LYNQDEFKISQEKPLFDLSLFTFPITPPGKPMYPGFLVMLPPKKPARGRENDILILNFKLTGKSSITDAGLKTWLENKATAYHNSSGTVTSGMRTVFEDINEDLLQRNSKFAKQNGQISGSLQLMVLKKEVLYLAVFGTGSGFLVTKNEVEHIIDDENGGKGLGLAQSINIRFSQSNVETSNVLLFANDPPETWTKESLIDGQGLSNEGLYRRLFATGIGQAQGVMIRFREGTGKVVMLKPRTSELPTGEEETPKSRDAIVTPVPIIGKPITPEVSIPGEKSVPDVKPFITEAQRISHRPQNPASMTEAKLAPEPVARPVREPQSTMNLPLPKTEDVKAAVGGALRKGAQVKGKTETWLRTAMQKILPGAADQPLKFPKALLVFIAVAVPVIIVAIAASLYIRNGRNSLFDGYMAEAQQLAARAEGQVGDDASKLASLQESIYWLDKADQYGTSDQSTQLRQTVQTQLDDLQGITRINLIPAISTVLPKGTNIGQLAISGTDLYALDSTSGTVLRFFQSGSEYQQDTAFDCGPSATSPLVTIGSIVDMIPISTNNTYGASLLAIDSQGKLEYCVAGESGYVVSLAAPDMGWVGISSISLNQGNLYVMDVRGNAVYRFEGSGNQFPDKPTLFFDEVIPSLAQAIDIEVIGYELYILRSNGEMVECTYSPIKDMKSTECEDPAIFNDNRGGQTVKTSTFAGASFTQMHMTLAPDSSLYLLDTAGKTVYHLSYARNLQGVLHPRMTDGENIDKYSPTAFAVSNTRQVFMAFGSLIYYGQMP
jgi:hypothetical protein